MCENLATYRFTWPGDDEQVICEEHKPKLEAVPRAMGFHLQIIPLPLEDMDAGLLCNQK
jgi:hypothetical protein